MASLTRATTVTGTGHRDRRAASLNSGTRAVAFRSDSDLLNDGRPAGVFGIWRHDAVAMTYTRVTSATCVGSRGSTDPSLSSDGMVVALDSDAGFQRQTMPDSQSEIWLWRNHTCGVCLPLVVHNQWWYDGAEPSGWCCALVRGLLRRHPPLVCRVQMR